MRKLLRIIPLFAMIAGCSTVQYQTSNRCLAYHLSDGNYSWRPTELIHDDNYLYIKLPESANFTPKLEVMDVEFSQPTLVPYTYDEASRIIKVKDNYDQYLLFRRDVEDFYQDTIKIDCIRKLPVSK
jgi:hypothetical protein